MLPRPPCSATLAIKSLEHQRTSLRTRTSSSPRHERAAEAPGSPVRSPLVGWLLTGRASGVRKERDQFARIRDIHPPVAVEIKARSRWPLVNRGKEQRQVGAIDTSVPVVVAGDGVPVVTMQQDRHIGGVVGGDQIEPPIAIEVRHRHGGWIESRPKALL